MNKSPVFHGKKCKESCPLFFLRTLYSLKWWHHLKPVAPSTSYRILEQVKWHFFHSSKDQCVSNQIGTENIWKRSSDLGAWWGFDLPDLTANEYNSESPVSFGYVPCRWNSQAKHQPGERISTGANLGMFPNRIKANTLWDMEENPNLCSLPWDFLNLCLTLLSSGTLGSWRERIVLSRGFQY